jgi:predicted transcriptional regulator
VATDGDYASLLAVHNVQSDTITVQQCMATTSVTVRPEDDVEKALALIREN